MKLPLLLFATLTVLTSSCLAETGIVIFYSASFPVKDQLKEAVSAKGTTPFTGWLFDGNQALAHAQPGHFVSFHVPPGQHTFSVSYNSEHPSKTQAMPLNIEDGRNYCICLSQKYANALVLPVQRVQGLIEVVDCQQAFHDAGDTKPLEIKRVEKSARGMLITLDKFPNTD